VRTIARLALLTLLGGCDKLFDLTEIPIPDAPPACPVVDEFEGSAFDPMWDIENPPSSVTVKQTGGQLVITPQPLMGGYNGLYTIARHSLVGMTVHVELSESLSDGTGDVEMIATLDHRVDGNYYMIYASHTFLGFRVKNGSTPDEDGIAYSRSEHRFWRLRFDAPGTTIMFETSADDISWTQRRVLPVTVPITSMQLELIAGSYNGGLAIPGEAHFDHFSVCPTR
jgi:hypothetical protein